jgi:hypothetical protein
MVIHMHTGTDAKYEPLQQTPFITLVPVPHYAPGWPKFHFFRPYCPFGGQ